MEEDTHYCLKCGSTVIGIDNYITHRKVTCEVGLDGKMDAISEHVITDTFSCEKSDSEKNKESDHVQADDFFSSLELQSSSKSSSNMISLSFPNKLSGGIVTRSKSLSVVHQEILKVETIPALPKSKYKKKSSTTRKKGKGKKEVPKMEATTTSDDIGAFLKKSDDLDEKCGEKDDDEWLLFSHLGLKKSNNEETDDKLEAKKANEQTKRYTPELFSMSPILMPDVLSEGKDEVGNFLGDDYDDSYLHIDEMDEFNYAPPRTHTGGKWKPGSLSMRTSPILWPGQNWETLLDDKHQEDEKRPETIDDSSNDKKEANTKPPATHTGGKWKPTAPPSTHTGGKWKPSEPPATHTGGKWRPESRNGNEPPATHTGGKWKPHPGPNHTSGKWKPEEVSPDATHSKTMNAIASCQSTSGKCLKTAGGRIQYYCAPCDRRLASKKMYKKHVLSELHFKRVLQENDLEFDSRSLKVFRGLFTAVGYKERGLGKRTIKRPEHFKEMDMSTGKRVREIKTEKPKRKKIVKKEMIRCDVCKTKVPSHQLGKHLVSYYHSRRIQLSDPVQQKLVLDNIHAIVLQAPFQCGICKFYCNTHSAFKKHWADTQLHKESGTKIFWCSFCNFECKTPLMMELHLDSNSHREVISAVNKSIPIIIRQKNILNCKFCSRTFRFNRELSRHNRIKHGVNDDNIRHFRCPVCKYKARGIKSLQRHIILSHKNRGKTPYFCNACNMTFESADEAMRHRKTQYHKCKSLLKNVDVTKVPEEEFFMSRLCHYCGRIQDDLGKLKEHINEEHPTLRPKCAKCGKIFTLSQEVSRHIRDNLCNFSQEEENNEEVVEGEVSGEIHRCKLCKYTSAYKSELLFHQAMHDKGSKDKNPVKMRCPLCKKLFRRFALKVHLRTHTGERPYLCKFCPRSFVRRDRLNQHLRADHEAEEKQLLVEQELKRGIDDRKEDEEEIQDSEEDASDDKEQGRAKCGNPKCKYSPKDAEDLAEHVKIHVGPNLFQCPTCGYKAKTNTLFKRHNKIHLDERSHPCPHCSFRGRLASHLKRHMRLHTGAKPYKCPHCSYKCNILENLRKHVLYTKIHPGKCLYECKLCDFSNNSAKDFKLHLYDNHYDHFKTDYNITAYVSGIYCREDDPLDTNSPIPAKKRASPQPKIDRPEIFNKVSILTRKFEKIAPKPSFSDKPIVTPSLTLKNTGNSIEDKRKLLQLELLKLRQQAKKKQTETIIKSYPSPTTLKAEKEMKIRLEEEKRKAEEEEEADEEEEEEMEIAKILNPPIKTVPPKYTILAENGLVYLKIPTTTVISIENETQDEIMFPGKEVEEEEVEEKTDEVLEGNASPTYIFYDESDMITEESEEMLVGEEFYVLQD